MKSKYGLIKCCGYCGTQFQTKPRFVEYCSTKCKNPLNRGEFDAWNKGKKMSEEFKLTKMNLEGLSKGRGWNKGIPNEIARQRMLGDRNPNWDGRVNNLRPKKEINDSLILYKREVKKATYRTLKELKSNGNFIPKFGKGKNDLQIDHIIPYKQGFELGIPASIMGGAKNLQFLRGEYNRLKWDNPQPLSVVKAIIGENLYGLQ